MNEPAPSTAAPPRKLKAPKSKLPPDPNYIFVHTGLRSIHETVLKLMDAATAHEQSIDARKAEHHQLVQAFLANPDNRPKFKAVIHNKVWTIAFNDYLYRFGPRDDLNSLDEGEPMYFWTDPDGVTTFVMSNVGALLACISHFCNGGRE